MKKLIFVMMRMVGYTIFQGLLRVLFLIWKDGTRPQTPIGLERNLKGIKTTGLVVVVTVSD